ncbi:dimeric dUTPase (all-alpha-NTP-PPase superfamily) [Salsuginibacillus halophilus]|uniref:Dimeric dUTPase (All-alpha-NTP-PPase superfamily) n=1 Tax=Salsuginibacillus halophilus TaxID=517424 RepID=A0A2P8H667_9BACI|nr:dUTP diphosphatase [Salsuginibacillus halophilus]PSL41722.1 dimeric dUTPase (all-alpha-NTP-PPase superfamily) [Salsuginibacillus halophilus]
MNLQAMFDKQRELDEKIVHEKGLQDESLFEKKVLALQVELGELANEWRGFKFWSGNSKPRNYVESSCSEENAEFYYCVKCKGNFDIDHELECDGNVHPMKRRNPILEEYVDCLHFILSLGLEIDETVSYVSSDMAKNYQCQSPSEQFNLVYKYISTFTSNRNEFWYVALLRVFFSLGMTLGFCPTEIREAYWEKNKVNHERQATGY